MNLIKKNCNICRNCISMFHYVSSNHWFFNKTEIKRKRCSRKNNFSFPFKGKIVFCFFKIKVLQQSSSAHFSKVKFPFSFSWTQVMFRFVIIFTMQKLHQLGIDSREFPFPIPGNSHSRFPEVWPILHSRESNCNPDNSREYLQFDF